MLRFYRQSFKAMGSPCELQFFASGDTQAKAAIQAALSDVQRLEARYSRYRPDSFLSRINEVAAVAGRIQVDEETAGLLHYADTCHQQSDGLFDVTSGLLRHAWRFDQSRLPTPDQIAPLLERIGWDKLDWNPPWLEFRVPGMELDFGGVVKEYAVDRAAAFCWEAGIRHGLINLGGDIKVIGPRPDGTPWNVGIRHPRDKSAVLDSIAVHQGALASSGDYERCIVIGDARYGHVLNPKTGWPVRYLASVSVVGEFCVVAGSASTIAMLREDQGPAWLASLGLDHLWVTVDGEVGGSLAISVTD